MTLDVEAGRRTHRVLAQIDEPECAFIPGQRLLMEGTFGELSTVEHLPYMQHVEVAAARRGCVAKLVVEHMPQILDATPSWSARCTAAAERRMLSAGADDDALALYSAILLGDDSMLGGHTLADFRAAGIAHTLALSGFHIGFIAMLAGVLLFWMRLWPTTFYLRLWLVVAIVWAYAVLTGLAVPTVRACIMATVMVATQYTGRRTSRWNALGISIMLILAAAPGQLSSAGFLLSVCAVAGIVAFARPLNPVDERNRTARLAVDMVAVPAAAVMGTFVVSAWFFHTIPVYFLLSGIFIGVIFPLLMLGAVAMVGAGALGIHSEALTAAANALVHFSNGVTAEIASWSGGVAAPAFITAAGVACVGGVVVCAALALNYPVRRVVAGCLVAMVALSVMAFRTAPQYPATEVFAVPTGRAVSFVMRGEGQVHTVTTAPARYRDAARRELLHRSRHYLRSRGCDSIGDFIEGDFTLGVFARRGQYLICGESSVGIPEGNVLPDSLPGGARYVLLTNQCRVSAVDVLRRMNPDTLVEAPMLTEKRCREFETEARRRGVPVVDMRRRAWAPVLRQ